MSALEIVGGVLLILVSLIIIAAVTLQEPKGKGLSGTFGGNDSSYFDRNQGRTMDAKLAKLTKMCGAALFVLTLGVLAVNMYLK